MDPLPLFILGCLSAAVGVGIGLMLSLWWYLPLRDERDELRAALDVVDAEKQAEWDRAWASLPYGRRWQEREGSRN